MPRRTQGFVPLVGMLVSLLLLLALFLVFRGASGGKRASPGERPVLLPQEEVSGESSGPTDEETLTAAITSRKASEKQIRPGTNDLSELFFDSNRAFMTELDKLPPEYYAPQGVDATRNGQLLLEDLRKASDEAEKARQSALRLLEREETTR
ncbi:MAG TPA: hypothetical protein PLP29_18865 [Candidatus Ozemobacteraceae bacterium]|nr:hypothetical protein [Candidatus Ozemobacteraceae bacterium]